MKALVTVLLMLATALFTQAGPLPYDTAPQLLTGRMPKVDAESNGYVAIIVDIDADGRVAEAAIKESTDPDLAAACLHAVRSWEFAPAFKQGRPIPTTVVQPFRFGDRPLPPIRKVAFAEPDLSKADFAPTSPETSSTEPSQPAPLAVTAPPVEPAAPAPTTAAPAEVNVVPSTPLATTTPPTAVPPPSSPASVTPASLAQAPAGKPMTPALNRLPSVRRTVTPELPERALQATGRVNVLFNVTEKGEVASVEAKEATDPQLTEPILEAAKRWAFRPAVKNGKPVGSKVIVPFLVGTD